MVYEFSVIFLFSASYATHTYAQNVFMYALQSEVVVVLNATKVGVSF